MDDMDNDYESESESWNLSESDRELIARLIALIRKLIPKARDGYVLAGLGELWHDLQEIVDCEPESAVIVTFGGRAGDEGFEEGRYADISFTDDGLCLGRMVTQYSSDVGSDHESEQMAWCGSENGFHGDPEGWFEWAESLASWSVTIEVERLHLG